MGTGAHEAEALRAAAIAADREHRWADSIEAWTRYLAAEPRDAYAWWNRAQARRLTGDTEGAYQDATVSIDLHYGYEAFFQRAITGLKLSRYAAVRDDLGRALELADTEGVCGLELPATLGVAYDTRGIARFFLDALARDPSSAFALSLKKRLEDTKRRKG
jgi:hypothetical protein